jgi:hypothetical protein
MSSSSTRPRRRAVRRLRWLLVLGAVVGAVSAVRARALARDQELFVQRYGPRAAA